MLSFIRQFPIYFLFSFVNYLYFFQKRYIFFISFATLSYILSCFYLFTIIATNAETSPFFHVPTEKKVRFQISFIKLSYNIVLDIIQQFSISGERPYIFIHQHFQRICGNTQRLHGFKDVVTAEYSLENGCCPEAAVPVLPLLPNVSALYGTERYFH